MKANGKQSRVEWSRPAELPGVEILLAEGDPQPWRWLHETYSICTLLQCDECVWMYRGKTHTASTGNIMLMEPGEIHANTKAPIAQSFRVVLINPSVVECAARELGDDSTPHLKAAAVKDPALFRAFAEFHASIERPATVLERQSMFATCLHLFLENCTEAPRASSVNVPWHKTLREARELLEDCYTENITLNELAAATGLSRFHLVRAFASEFGLPPHAYLIQIRVKRARALLEAGFPPSAIATVTGFADQSHFIRHFKRVFHVTPGEYSATH